MTTAYYRGYNAGYAKGEEEASRGIDRLKSLLCEIKRHWIDGVIGDTGNESSWHGTMRDLLDEIEVE